MSPSNIENFGVKGIQIPSLFRENSLCSHIGDRYHSGFLRQFSHFTHNRTNSRFTVLDEPEQLAGGTLNGEICSLWGPALLFHRFEAS